MNSLRDTVPVSPQLREIETRTRQTLHGEEEPQPLGPAVWDWQQVKKVLLVRLRSIGDSVLATPTILALKRFVPQAQIDILLEDWVAPVLEGHGLIDRIIRLERASVADRLRVARELRAEHYDVVYNLHGGTTATLLSRASGARHRVGYATYQYAKLHNHQSPSPLLLWGQPKTHSVEQQLALVGWTGVPVTDRPPTQLAISPHAEASVGEQLKSAGLADKKFALIHPAAAFATKQWATENFARVVEFLGNKGLPAVAIAGPHEQPVLDALISESAVQVTTFDLSLPEVTALAKRAQIFVGNDSGIAHIVAAVKTPCVVIFGSSNTAHWRPWNTAPAEVVLEKMPCQPCHGYFCEKFPQPECILRVPVERVTGAIERLLT